MQRSERDPEVGLKAAREKLVALRRQLDAGIEPTMAATIACLGESTFEAVAREWYAKFSATWVPTYGDRILPVSNATTSPGSAVVRSTTSRPAS